MKKFFSLLIAVFPFFHVYGEKGGDVEKLRVKYYMLARDRKDMTSPREKWYQLSIGEKSSHCFQVAPPFKSTDGIIDVFVFKDPIHVYKGIPESGQLTFIGEINWKHCYYVEPSCGFEWDVEEGDTLICGYQCQKASTAFGGRKWNVWYTLDVPYSDGPWKLCGLPGLIMKADDDKGDYSFTAVEISKGNGRRMEKADLRGIDKMTKEKFVKEQLRYARDPLSFIQEDPNGCPGWIYDAGKGEYVPVAENPYQLNLIENIEEGK